MEYEWFESQYPSDLRNVIEHNVNDSAASTADFKRSLEWYSTGIRSLYTTSREKFVWKELIDSYCKNIELNTIHCETKMVRIFLNLIEAATANKKHLERYITFFCGLWTMYSYLLDIYLPC